MSSTSISAQNTGYHIFRRSQRRRSDLMSSVVYGVHGGESLTVRLPDGSGRTVSVRVPFGMTTGSTFGVPYEAHVQAYVQAHVQPPPPPPPPPPPAPPVVVVAPIRVHFTPPPVQKKLHIDVPPGTPIDEPLIIEVPDEPGRYLSINIPPNVTEFDVAYTPRPVAFHQSSQPQFPTDKESFEQQQYWQSMPDIIPEQPWQQHYAGISQEQQSVPAAISSPPQRPPQRPPQPSIPPQRPPQTRPPQPSIPPQRPPQTRPPQPSLPPQRPPQPRPPQTSIPPPQTTPFQSSKPPQRPPQARPPQSSLPPQRPPQKTPSNLYQLSQPNGKNQENSQDPQTTDLVSVGKDLFNTAYEAYKKSSHNDAGDNSNDNAGVGDTRESETGKTKDHDDEVDTVNNFIIVDEYSQVNVAVDPSASSTYVDPSTSFACEDSSAYYCEAGTGATEDRNDEGDTVNNFIVVNEYSQVNVVVDPNASSTYVDPSAGYNDEPGTFYDPDSSYNMYDDGSHGVQETYENTEEAYDCADASGYDNYYESGQEEYAEPEQEEYPEPDEKQYLHPEPEQEQYSEPEREEYNCGDDTYDLDGDYY